MCDCIEKMDADLKKIGQQLKLVELVYVKAPIGKLTTIAIPIVNKKKETIAVKCEKCGNTENYRTRNIPQEWKFESDGQPCDSYFGLPLWLIDNFRGNIFWALNYDHLEYLKNYITADIRERNNRIGWTMVEKLPEWMKSGKNRIKLTKVITDLEKK